MSGVVAILERDGRTVRESAVEAATDRLRVHGPDGRGTWVGGSAGLGHQLLRATPEADRVDHPVERAGTIVTADVRLDNRPALRATLDAEAGLADAELLALAYERWGRRCPEYLVGAFAFAVRDPERDRLFCARDHTGLKPLYYHRSSDRVAVATAPPALLALPDVGDAPDDVRVGDFLAGRFVDRRRSFYAEIDRLPPGHSLTATADSIAVEEYWSLADVEPLPQRPRGHYRRRFRALFERAVADRLRCPDPAGSLLSGGLDSSSIVAVADRLCAERKRAPLRTFSAVFDDVPVCDESEYVDAVVDAAADVVPHAIRGDRVEPLADAETLLRHRGEPYYPALFLTIPRLFEAAGDAGVRAVMHGYGGDQTMGSDVRGYYRGLARRGRVLALARELRAYCDRYPGIEPHEALWRDVLRPMAPAILRRARHATFDDDRYVRQSLASIDPDFAARSGLDERLAGSAVESAPGSQRALRRRSLTADETPFNLELNHAAGAAAGVEPRFPYLDSRLVAFAAGLPPGTTVDRGLDRTLVRDALVDVLPRAVRERDDKAEFSPAIRHCVERYERDRLRTILFDGEPATARYLDLADLRGAFDRLAAGEGSGADARNLLLSATLELWLSGPDARK